MTVFIIKKGLNPSIFTVEKNKNIIINAEPILNKLTNEEYDLLIKKYGGFFLTRIFNEKTNPKGCFIVDRREDLAKDTAREVLPDLVDNSKPVKAEENKKTNKKSKK
jgi:hypothetical protein